MAPDGTPTRLDAAKIIEPLATRMQTEADEIAAENERSGAAVKEIDAAIRRLKEKTQ